VFLEIQTLELKITKITIIIYKSAQVREKFMEEVQCHRIVCHVESAVFQGDRGYSGVQGIRGPPGSGDKGGKVHHNPTTTSI